MTFLAIEQTDDGELLHGVSADLGELQERVLTAIIGHVIADLTTAQEREDIAQEVIARFGFTTTAPAATAAVAVYDRVLGVARTREIFTIAALRIQRTKFTEEGSSDGDLWAETTRGDRS